MQFAIYNKTSSNCVTSVTLTNVPVTFHWLIHNPLDRKLLVDVSVCDILKSGWGNVATSGVEK